MVQTLPDGDYMARGRRCKRALDLHRFWPDMAGNEEPMTYFLEGLLVGILGGFIWAYVAFNGVTKKMANAIYEGTEKCHR
jgi:hypothetical protein